MKILYGVQGTGNGHISRASAMYESFKRYPDIEVDWLLSGRERERGCGAIEHFMWREGLTFVTHNGRVNILKTLAKNNLGSFWKDVKALDLSPYDLVICDYEPVIAQAARRQDKHLLGIGHQYAFNFDIPMRGANPLVKTLMRRFAPVDQPVGLHWHHFGYPILPPIVDLMVPDPLPLVQDNKILVYLPFESLQTIEALLRPMKNFECYIYHPELRDSDDGHLHWRAISRLGFKQDLLSSAKVITNSGFELMSECLVLGREILTKPLHGQMEQLSNALALEQLGYATVLNQLEPKQVADWIGQRNPAPRVAYPDVAAHLTDWIVQGCKESIESLASRLWQGCEAPVEGGVTDNSISAAGGNAARSASSD